MGELMEKARKLIVYTESFAVSPSWGVDDQDTIEWMFCEIGRLEKENAELFRKWSTSKSVRESDLEEKLKTACRYRNEGCEKLEEEVTQLRVLLKEAFHFKISGLALSDLHHSGDFATKIREAINHKEV